MKELSYLRDVEGVTQVVRRFARELTGADGVTFVLREGDQVFYAEENAIAPLWKGRRFPATACISGWAILRRESVAIEDIYADERIPHDAYRSTFVRSLAMVPVRVEDPLGAIGAYWATNHLASPRELQLLESLAAATAIALANAELYLEAQDAIRVRDEFMSLASHELKTPLTPLQLRIQSARRAIDRGAEPAAVRDALLKAEDNLQRLGRLVDSLLDISRISRGAMCLERQPLDLGALAAQVVERHRAEVEQAGSVLTLRLAPGVVGQWDAARLEQVLVTLLANAVKYGEGKPIELEVDRREDGAYLSVRDRGLGISTPDQARLFQRFERAVPSRHFGGFGMGLWMARRIVEAHGGTIECQSAPGAGSAFTVRLPDE